MRMVIQRVKEAAVRVDGKVVGQINKGALVLFGAAKTDIPAYTVWMAQKLVGLRYFSDAQGKMNLSLQDIQGQLLIVSQFTLYANCNEGRRPGFDAAAPGSVAKMLYDKFIEEVQVELYTNNLKNREFGKEAPQNLCSERATIAERQGASENKDSEVKPTPPKTDSSSCLCIKAEVQTGVFGADMEVSLINDGPVTFVVDYPEKI